MKQQKTSGSNRRPGISGAGGGMEAPLVVVGQGLIRRVAAFSSYPLARSRCSSSTASWRRPRGRRELKGRGPCGAWADGGKCITLDLAIGSTSAEVVVLGRRVDLACQRGRWWQGYYGGDRSNSGADREGGETECEMRWQRCDGDKAS